MTAVGNWILETTNTIGTGVITLGGAVAGFASFASAIPEGDVWYSIEDSNGNREVGIGSFDGESVLVRTDVRCTLIGSTYNYVNPTAISLSGNATVSCTFGAPAYEELLTLIEDAGTAVNVSANEVSYNSAGDPITSSADVQLALIAHGLAIEENTNDIADATATLQSQIDDLIADNGFEIIEEYFEYADFVTSGYNTVITTATTALVETLNNLDIYVSGVIQRFGVDFEITAPSTITLLDKILGENDYVLMKLAVPVIPDLDLRGNLAESSGASLVGFISAGAGAVARTVQDKAREVVSVKDFGAVGDNSIDDTTALQTAITYCSTNRLRLYVPKGTYKITANLTIPAGDGFTIQGDGYGTIFNVSSAVTRIFDVASGATNLTIKNMVLSGDGAAGQALVTTYGIYAPGLSHCSFEGLVVELCVTGIYIRNGWCNNFFDVKVWYCETGVNLGLSPNQCTFTHCKFWLCSYGVILQSGFATAFYNCLFESNAKVGLVINSSSTLISACYFEANCVVIVGQHPTGTVAGVTFTTPAQTVYADIILQGGGVEWLSGTMSIYSPPVSTTIESCFTAPVVDEAGGAAFVYAIASRDLSISGCSNNGDPIPLIKTYENSSYTNNQNVSAFSNNNFSKNLALDNHTDGEVTLSPGFFRYCDNVSRVNFAETRFNRWTIQGAGPGVYARKNIAGPLGNKPLVWSYVEASTNTTVQYGFSLTAADYPENIGKYFTFGIQAKAGAAGVVLNIYGKANAAVTLSSTDWISISSVFLWPASGSILFLIFKSGNAADLYFCNPVIMELGNNLIDEFGKFGTVNEFVGSSAPSTGDWLQGDRLYDISPASGTPIGWGCSVSGTPGTWIAMSNYA